MSECAIDAVWEGDLRDDCTIRWRGLIGRAECMHNRPFEGWWAAVYDTTLARDDREVWSTNDQAGPGKIGGVAVRLLVEQVMRRVVAERELEGLRRRLPCWDDGTPAVPCAWDEARAAYDGWCVWAPEYEPGLDGPPWRVGRCRKVWGADFCRDPMSLGTEIMDAEDIGDIDRTFGDAAAAAARLAELLEGAR